MIKVEIFRGQQNQIKSFKVSGHAKWAASGEIDLVCGVVSGLTLTALNGLIGYLNLELPDTVVEDGYMHCVLPDNLEGKTKDQAEAILETMVIGLNLLEKDFPKHVRIV